MDIDGQLQAIARKMEAFFAPDQPVGVPEMLFVVGLQLLGRPAGQLSRDDKMTLIHIGTCAILEPYGYYRLTGRDETGYPQYELLRPVSETDAASGELLKEALAKYFADW